ncbi:MAG: hypothetical protein EU530_03495 [Promethearchaeota archaeon]|nr:MAG: hypothetical protein EU530_03495 [Candidatus Lokiarchaeota archaeon]
MFNYPVEQKSYNLGKYSIGGDPRSTRTAMVGTIFYYGQKKIFIDEKKGIIDKEYAETLIKKQEEMADKTGLVPCLDVIFSFEDAIKPLLDFVLDITDCPIFFDPPTFITKKPALRYLNEIGIYDRIIYNSITPDSYDEEYKLLSDSKIEHFVLLAIESKYWTTLARLDVIERMISKAKTSGFLTDNFLIDTCVLDFTSIGLAMSAMEKVKKKYGYPVGTAGHIVVDTWRNLKNKFGDVRKIIDVVASAITLGSGADFVMYGPIQNADIMFPSVAFVKAAHSQLMFDEGKIPPENHPVFKIG